MSGDVRSQILRIGIDVVCDLLTAGCYNERTHNATERITAMTTIELDQLYEQQIKLLPPAVRLQLVARIAQDLAVAATDEPEHSLLELEGLGAEIWQGIDAQQYVNELRDEWDRP